MIWSIFKKRKWIDETLPEICGKAHGLRVTIQNFPCRREEHQTTRKYRYPDFGSDFRTNLMDKQLADFPSTSALLSHGKAVQAHVSVRDLPEVLVRIEGQPHNKEGEFFSQLADAIIDAFEQNGIKP